jgi:cell division protein FtsZ
MEDLSQNDTFNFDLPKNQSSVIKVIGVGGGGSNAVNHMYRAGIKGVDFAVCNTDAQALENSPVPNKIQLGVNLTEGLGAGANPEVGQQAAIENIEEIKNVLHTNTKMLFITAGMGGGTGTGAAPVIAKAAKESGILTVGIVTMPFLFEGNNRKVQAEKGIEALRKNVDSLVVINNNKLREVYGNLGFKAGFSKADEVLATAARGIAEVITHHYTTNIDLRDAKTVLADSGTAIMGSGSASGENRAIQAISGALDSPLLNDNHIHGAKNVLLLIVSGKEEITIDEIGEINDHIQAEAGGNANIIMGIGEDESLENEISVTIVATGFAADQQVQVIGREPQKVVHTLEDEQAISTSLYNKPLSKNDGDDDAVEKELAMLNNLPKQAKPHDLFSFEEDESEEVLPQQPEEPEMQVEVPPTSEIPSEVRYTLEDEVEESAALEETLSPAASIEEDEPVTYFAPHAENIGEEAEEEDTTIYSLDADDEEVEMSFFIGEEAEEPVQEMKAEEPTTPKKAPEEEKPQPEAAKEEPKVVRHSLEDYLAFEKSLTESKAPENKTNNQPEMRAEAEDEELNFQVKTKETTRDTTEDNTPMRNGRVSYEDLPIEEGIRLKQEERRSQLKQFNHRFKAHSLSSIDKVENIPAYKRQGLNIEDGKYSNESNVSRFSIDENADGTDIKSNNSFLHDNVD